MLNIKTRADFDNLLSRIAGAVRYYEASNTKRNKYIVYLSNEDRFTYTVDSKNIAHLLGVNFVYLRSIGIFDRNCSSYDVLKGLQENSYSLYMGVQEGRLSYESMFSEHIEDKLSALELLQDNWKFLILNLFASISKIELTLQVMM